MFGRLFILLLLFFPCFLFGQDNLQNIDHKITSSVYNTERTIRVFLPEIYMEDTANTFIVTYILDAQSDDFWNMAKSNINYMVSSYSVIPMIVVGIVSDNRGSEFEPPGDQLQQHLKEEVFPLIKEKYRVKEFKSVIGHSWGGAFIGSTLFSEDRDLFDAYIGIAPSFGDTDNEIEKGADSLLNAGVNFGKFLYLSHGNVGRREAEFGGYVNKIRLLTQQYQNPTLAFVSKEFEGTDHWGVVIPSINGGLMEMSRNYFADQQVLEKMAEADNVNLLDEIEKFYTHKEEVFSFSYRPSMGYYRFVANDFRDSEQYNIASELYKMILNEHPESVKVQVDFADTIYKKGESEKALEAFQHVLVLLEKNKEKVSDNYYENIKKWASEKIEELKK